jgi:hypothetical protein
VYYGAQIAGNPPLPLYVETSKAEVTDSDSKKGHNQKAYLKLRKVMPQKELSNYTVCFRIEVYVSKRHKTVFYEGRFTCHFSGGKLILLTITEGPVVDCVTPTSAIVSFTTDKSTKAKVLLTAPDGKTSEYPSAQEGQHHEIELSHLPPNTAYNYEVVASTAQVETRSQKFQFTSAPKESSHFKFAAMTDSRASHGGEFYSYHGVNLTILRSLCLSAYNKGAKFIVFPGDLVDGYTTSVDDFRQQLRAWRYAVEPITHYLPIYEGMGNHEFCMDCYSDGSRYGLAFDKKGSVSTEAIFAEMFVNPKNGPEPDKKNLPPYKENVYFVDYAQLRFIVLNTNYWICYSPEQYGGNVEGYLLPAQMQWLAKVLEDAQKSDRIEHIFIGTHEPIFPGGPHVDDGMWYYGGLKELNNGHDRSYMIRLRDKFWQMLVANPKVRAVICGDEHFYMRMLIDDKTPVYADGSSNPHFKRPIWQFITGGAGAPIYMKSKTHMGDAQQYVVPWKNHISKMAYTYHYLLFDVSQDKLTMECIAHNDSVIDRLALWEKSP